MTATRFTWSYGCVLVVSLVGLVGLVGVGCKSTAMPPPSGGSSGTVSPAAGSSATAGSAATAGTTASGSGGSLSTAGSGATAGMSVAGTAGASTSGTGAGGMSVGGNAASGSGGNSTAGGSAGASAGASGAAAGASGGAGSDPATTQCIADVMASGTAVTDCERCLCETANCQTEMNALKGDTAANALIACTKAHNCSGQCCLCKTNDKGATCDSLGGNYAKGDCAAEVETAAGVTPGAGAITNGAKVKDACSDTGPETNACARATRVATCATSKCKAQCPSVTVACPAP